MKFNQRIKIMLKHRICWRSSTGKTGNGEWFDSDHIYSLIAAASTANREHQNIDHWIETKNVSDQPQENNQKSDGPMPSAAEEILQELLNGGILGREMTEINESVLEAINAIRAVESRAQDTSAKLSAEIKKREFYQQQAYAEQGANAMLSDDLKKTSDGLARERAKVLRLAAMNARLIRKNRDAIQKLSDLAKMSGFIVIID